MATDLSSYLELLSFGDKGWGDEFLTGAWMTIQISVCGYAIGLALGLCGAWGKLSGNKVSFWISESYTTIVRAVPELLLIILLYYTGTTALRNLLVMSASARTSRSTPSPPPRARSASSRAPIRRKFSRRHALRAQGAIGGGQGLWHVRSLRFRRIMFPLMFRYALPGLSNLWVSILKDSSLISVVGFSELLFSGKTAAASTKDYFFFYLATAAMFLLLTVMSNVGIHFVERRLMRGVRRA
jgi:amine acid ABC transporter, permease protein, 3-TM region, His/Glu/Gln/Arg/opine family